MRSLGFGEVRIRCCEVGVDVGFQIGEDGRVVISGDDGSVIEAQLGEEVTQDEADKACASSKLNKPRLGAEGCF